MLVLSQRSALIRRGALLQRCPSSSYLSTARIFPTTRTSKPFRLLPPLNSTRPNLRKTARAVQFFSTAQVREAEAEKASDTKASDTIVMSKEEQHKEEKHRVRISDVSFLVPYRAYGNIIIHAAWGYCRFSNTSAYILHRHDILILRVSMEFI